MAWVRLHDDALSSPKILAISDRAFRLWVWGLTYAQRHLTDGFIPTAALPSKLKAGAPELMRPGGRDSTLGALWHIWEGGFMIHDYLVYNDAKEVILKKRGDAKDRMQAARDRHTGEDRRAAEAFARTSLANNSRSSPELLRSVGTRNSQKLLNTTNPDRESAFAQQRLSDRAHTLRDDLYPAWYAHFRHGARLRLMANTLDYQAAISLCETWDDARLEQLARVFLTTDEPWIAGTDRSFRIFASKASWADDRLKQAELSEQA